MSAGAKRAMGLAGGWALIAVSAAVSVVFFNEIKVLGRGLVGLPEPALMQSARAERTRDRPAPAGAVGRVVELKAGSHGHYYASAEINGRPIDVMVDSGASIVALTYDDAQRAGVHIRERDYTHRVNTANGQARVAPVVLDRVSVGDITVRNVPAAVSEPGRLNKSLLGMSFLSRLSRVDMRSGILVLQE
ncbi:MAG: TIGR02281 family clan AA aspartic protease [Hyphomicrobiaceae bacterium]|nr:MAG: TIGR02281 family clan AA aspartic protease [Hyphomicrobiaceae bacterium]